MGENSPGYRNFRGKSVRKAGFKCFRGVHVVSCLAGFCVWGFGFFSNQALHQVVEPEV